MPVSQFTNAILEPNGDLTVAGPFDPEGATILGDVVIVFMLVQDNADASAERAILKDVAIWDGPPGARSEWSKTIPAARVHAAGIQAGPIRSVGAAIVVRHVDPEPVPLIDGITWCVHREIIERSMLPSS